MAEVEVGIQVLLKKAEIDSDFRTALLDTHAQAAKQIVVELSTTEVATLNSVPRIHLEKIAEHTAVPDHERRVFLGQFGGGYGGSIWSQNGSARPYRTGSVDACT